MLPEAHISHCIPHRIRLKIPSKKKDLSFFSELNNHFSSCEAIEHVEVNPLTGSILLIHSLDTKEIVAYALEKKLFSVKEVKPYSKQTYISRKISETFTDMNSKVLASTKGFSNIPDLLVLTLIGLSVFQISRGNFIAPAWYTALWYAMNIFLKGQTREA